MHKKNKLKSISTFLIILALFAVSVFSVNAIGFTMPDSIVLGSDNQDRDAFTQTPFTITNTDNISTITNIGVSFTSSIVGYTNSNFNITATGIPSQIDASNSTTITINGYVPKKFNSGQRQIGTIFVTAISNGASLSKTIPVFMNAASKLQIQKPTIDVDGDDESVSDGETIKVKRGQKITLTIPVKNMFSSSSDITINDVDVRVESGSDLDVDEEDNLGDIEARDENEGTITFDIPNDADDGKETITITAEGVDDNDATHTTTFRFSLDVEVKSYEVLVNSATTQPGGFCLGQTGTLSVNIENTGTRDLTKAMVYVKADDFSFSKRTTDIVLDEGDSKTITFQIPVDNTVRPGTYLVDITTYPQASSSTVTDTFEAMVTVKNCSTTQATTPVKTNTTIEVVTNNQGQTTGQTTSGQTFGTPVYKRSFSSDSMYIALLILGCVIVALLIVLVIRAGKSYY